MNSRPNTPEEWVERGILNEYQAEELKKAASNPILLEALEKVMGFELVTEGVFKNGQPFDLSQNFFLSYIKEFGSIFDDKRLGEEMRALFWGIIKIKEKLNTVRDFGKQKKVGGEKEPDYL